MIVLSLIMVCAPEAGAAEKKEDPLTIQWITGREGSAGYAIGASLGMLLQEEIPTIIKKVDVRPLGSLAGAKRIEKGTSEVTYTSAMAMHQQYNNLEYWAKHPTPPERRVLQGIWILAITMYAAVPEKRADKIKNYDDLAGKRFFIASPGGTLFLANKSVFETIGLWGKFKYADLPYGEVGGALAGGRLHAAVIYHISPAIAPSSWVTELLARQNVVILNPSDAQVAKMNAGLAGTGMQVVENDIPHYIKGEKGKKVRGWEFYWGWGLSPDLPEKYAYAITKTLVEQSHKKGAAIRHIEAFAKQPLDIMTKGIGTIPNLPVHPGVAKYLKEKGVWKDNWKIGRLTK